MNPTARRPRTPLLAVTTTVLALVAALLGLTARTAEAAAADAPGAPGATATWTTGDKEGIGTSRSSASKVWYTLTGGTMSEVYYPSGVTPNVRELQFAKAAISTGWSLLLEQLGLEHRDVQQVLLAGSFGSYLSPASAVRIGLVPRLPVLRIVAAGNVAGEGAKMALLSVRERAGALALLEEVTYVELSDRPEFNDRFVEQLAFGG